MVVRFAMVFGDGGTKEKTGGLAGSAQVTDSRWFGHIQRRDRKYLGKGCWHFALHC